MKIFLFFSHELTSIQIDDIQNNLKCNEIIKLPQNLQEIWSNVNPYIVENEKIDQLRDFLKNNAKLGDFVLIQGEWGLVYKMVTYSKQLRLRPIYSTTERKCTQEKQRDGTVKNVHYFKHIRFKEYE